MPNTDESRICSDPARAAARAIQRREVEPARKERTQRQIVADEHQRGLRALAARKQQRQERLAPIGVERRRWFVGDDEFGRAAPRSNGTPA
jgi:hypothetical protein